PKPAPFTEDPGPFRFSRFKALKNSARNWRSSRSFIWKCLATPISQLNRPGPRSAPLATLPNVPAAGSANAEGIRSSTHGALFWQVPCPETVVFTERIPGVHLDWHRQDDVFRRRKRHRKGIVHSLVGIAERPLRVRQRDSRIERRNLALAGVCGAGHTCVEEDPAPTSETGLTVSEYVVSKAEPRREVIVVGRAAVAIDL